jgi:hypothetical protein
LVVDELVIARERWSLLVAIDGRRTVRDLVERTGQPVLELCQTLLGLVDAGAAAILDADVASDRPAPAPAVSSPPADPPATPQPAPPVVPPEPVAPPEPPPSVPTPAPPRFETVVPPPAPPAAPEPVASEPEPDSVPEPEPVGANAGADKGTFLRMFSGLREN